MKLRQYNAFGRTESFEIACDDYTFNAVVRQGPIVSKPDHSVYREAIMLSQSETNFVFQMTLLEASRIAEIQPEFAYTGIVGSWSLSTSGFVKLVKAAQLSATQVDEFLQMPNSAEFIRVHYLK